MLGMGNREWERLDTRPFHEILPGQIEMPPAFSAAGVYLGAVKLLEDTLGSLVWCRSVAGRGSQPPRGEATGLGNEGVSWATFHAPWAGETPPGPAAAPGQGARGGEKGEQGPPGVPPKPCSSQCREGAGSAVTPPVLPKSPQNSAREGGDRPSDVQEPRLSRILLLPGKRRGAETRRPLLQPAFLH